MRSLIRKLKQTKGESLVEVLISVLISSFALLVLATMITTTTKLVTNSKDRFDKYVEAANTVTSRAGSSAGTVRFTKEDGSTAFILVGSSSTVDVNYSVNEEIGGMPVIAYEAQTP